MKKRIVVYGVMALIVILTFPAIFRRFSTYYAAAQMPQNYQYHATSNKPGDKGTGTTYSCLENTLAGFNLSGTGKISEREILAVYGNGCPEKNSDSHTRTYSYRSSSRLYVKLDIEQDSLVNVEVTKLPLASAHCPPLKDFKNFNSGKGLNIGDSDKTAREIYGEPYFYGKDYENPSNQQLLYADIKKFSSAPPEAIPPGHAFRIVISSDTVVSMQLITGE